MTSNKAGTTDKGATDVPPNILDNKGRLVTGKNKNSELNAIEVRIE